jgi:CPA1 family monovalent cation:H+ antiporter
MGIFELVIALLFAGAALSSWARRVRAPYPALLALAGAALTLIPNVPSITLDPALALTLFVAPVLLDAAFDSSPRDLKRDWRAVTGLALVAVGLTVISVALAARWIIPELPWAAAIALGAIVAPPDASAASVVLRQINPPHRVLVVVEGESLFNDASALLVYRFAVAAALSGRFVWGSIPMLAFAAVGSVFFAWGLSRLTPFLIRRVHDAPTSVVAQFVTTFAVWIAAERLHLSGIITVVVYAILVAQREASPMPARLRIPSYAVWDVAVFVLNVLAFILMGLQIKPILAHLEPGQVGRYFVAAIAVCVAVIVVRVLWVMTYSLVGNWILGRRGQPHPATVREGLKPAAVVAWCGMRGIVTLATALALPEGFPYRGFIEFCAYAVVIVTLVVQGVTLTPLLKYLRIEHDGSVDDEVHRARAETSRAALATLPPLASSEDGSGGPVAPAQGLTAFLRLKYEARLRHAERPPRPGDPGVPDEDPESVDAYGSALRLAQEAERAKLIELRAQGLIGDDAFHRVEEELDWAEVNAETMARAD